MTLSSITIDPIHNVAYILIKDNKVQRSVEIEEGVVADYNSRGDLVGIELVHTSSKIIEKLADKFKLRNLKKYSKPLSKMIYV